MSFYYLKQKRISITNKYYIYDISEKPVFEVVGNKITGLIDQISLGFFHLGHRFCVNNLNGQEEFILRKKPSVISSKYEILINDSVVASIIEGKTCFKSKIYITSDYGKFEIKGSIWAKNFTILKDGYEIGEFKKTFFNFTDSYEISIYKEEGELYKIILGIIIALHNCVYQEKS